MHIWICTISTPGHNPRCPLGANARWYLLWVSFLQNQYLFRACIPAVISGYEPDAGCAEAFTILWQASAHLLCGKGIAPQGDWKTATNRQPFLITITDCCQSALRNGLRCRKQLRLKANRLRLPFAAEVTAVYNRIISSCSCVCLRWFYVIIHEENYHGKKVANWKLWKNTAKQKEPALFCANSL